MRSPNRLHFLPTAVFNMNSKAFVDKLLKKKSSILEIKLNHCVDG